MARTITSGTPSDVANFRTASLSMSTAAAPVGGDAPTALAVPKRDFELAMKAHGGGNVIVALKLDGRAEQTAIIREVQRDPVSHEILHLEERESVRGLLREKVTA